MSRHLLVFAIAFAVCAGTAHAASGGAGSSQKEASPAELAVAAGAAYQAGDYRGAARLYREVVAAIEAGRMTEEEGGRWKSAQLDLARAEATLGNPASARAAMERVLAVDPAATVDPELFSPAFRREFEQARTRVAALPRLRLLVAARGGTGTVLVEGKGFGTAPAEVRLPAGRYRVGIASANGVASVPVDLRQDDAVLIDVAVAPDLRPVPTPVAPVVAPTGGLEAPGGWMRPVAWVSTGLAGAALGIAVWQAVAASSSYSEATGMVLPDGSLRPGVDPAAYTSAVNAYESERRNAWIAGGSALVLGGAATVLFVLAPGAHVEPAPGGLAFRF